MIFDRYLDTVRREEFSLRQVEALYAKEAVCECGCGQPTIVSWRTDRAKGFVKGEPLRFVKGHNARTRQHTAETRQKLRECKLAENNPLWKGEEAGYSSIHAWLRRHFPKLGVCEHCKREGSTDYAFLRHGEKYTRTRGDYRELCRACHLIFDRRQP